MTTGPSRSLMWASVVIALLVPAYLAVWFVLSGPGTMGSAATPRVVRVVLIIAIVTVGAHFLAGHRWARWTVALLALVFAGDLWLMFLQNPPMSRSWTTAPGLLLLGLSAVIAANAVWLLVAKSVTEFLDARRASVTPGHARVLRNLRWVLAGAVLAGVLTDVRGLLT